MRASSLSDARVVELVSKYFVPVLYSRDHYQLESEPKALRDEIRRMDVDVARRGLKGGNVCVFIMDPDGTVLATMPVQKANNPKNLVPFLEKLIEKEKFKPRKAEAVEASKAVAALAPHKPHTDGGLLLHVRTRHEG